MPRFGTGIQITPVRRQPAPIDMTPTYRMAPGTGVTPIVRTPPPQHIAAPRTPPDEPTRIGFEIGRMVGVPVILRTTGPENNPKVDITPLPSINTADVIRYETYGPFLYPIIKEPTRKRVLFRNRHFSSRSSQWLSGMGNSEEDIYQLAGFFSIVRAAASKALTLGKRIVKFPIKRFRTFRAGRQFKRGIRTGMARTPATATRKFGKLLTPGGKTVLASLLTMENLSAAKALFPPGSGMEDTYEELVQGGNYLEAAEMAEAVHPGVFGGAVKPETPKWVLPAIAVGAGLLYARSKKMI